MPLIALPTKYPNSFIGKTFIGFPTMSRKNSYPFVKSQGNRILRFQIRFIKYQHFLFFYDTVGCQHFTV